jgi:hypothetical protein
VADTESQPLICAECGRESREQPRPVDLHLARRKDLTAVVGRLALLVAVAVASALLLCSSAAGYPRKPVGSMSHRPRRSISASGSLIPTLCTDC